MFRPKPSLNNIKIAAPCTADWDGMIGSDRVRFCGQCNLNVYNISAMPRKDAENLIAQTEGRLCVRYYQRKDGTILTNNCPVGLRAIRKRVKRITEAAFSALLSFFAGIGLYSATLTTRQNVVGQLTPEPQIRQQEYPGDLHPLQGAIAPKPITEKIVVQGDIAMPIPKQHRKN